jgi:hypothetical protein
MKRMTHNTVGSTRNAWNYHAWTVGGSVRRRGSLLILCVTVLVIIALIGIAFLQRVRLDQAATARHERNYMNLVINGILSEVSTQLTNDIFDNTPTGKELYDYPWTKDVRQVDAFFINGNKVNGRVNGSGKNDGTGLFLSDHEDDRWLASSAPVYNRSKNTYNWLHLTNLTGMWLDLESPTVAGLQEPINVASTVSQPVLFKKNSDTDIAIVNLENIPTGRTIPLGVDADFDGIMDSRWQWVPLPVRDFAGRKYVMAVRIVDLGSMMNVNTATIGTLDGNTPYNSTMRGYAPTGADLGRLFFRVDYNDTRLISNGAFSGDWLREIQNLLDRRSLQGTSGALLASPVPLPLTASQNKRLWKRQASIYGNLDRNYVADSEMELRRLGGLNDFSITSPLESDMPKLLRQAPEFERFRGLEASYLDVVREPTGSNKAISKWFYGTNPSNLNDPDTNSVAVKNREFTGVRHMVTTASGAGAYVTKYGGASSGGGRLKFDLKEQFTNTAELRQRLQQAFRLPNPSAPNAGWYLGLNPSAQADLIEEYVLAIQDYSDEDYIPTEGTTRNGRAYGLERFPFLREVYLHQLYEDQDLNDGAGGPPDGTFETWVARPNTQGVVVELGNPFASRIEASRLARLIKVVVVQNGANVSTWTFTNAVPNIGARNDSGGNDSDILLLVSNQQDQTITGQNGQGTGANLTTDLNISSAPNRVLLANDTLRFNPNGSNITIELQVDVSPGGTGDWVTYDRMDTLASFPVSLPPHAPSATPSVAASSQHAQVSFRRDKQQINYVSVDTGNARTTDLPDISIVTGDFKASSHRMLTDASVGGGAWTPPPGFQLPLTNEPMQSTAELAWVHMFGFTRTAAFSERLSLFPDNEHFLLIDPTDPKFKVLPAPPTGVGLSHAAVLMNLVTTVSPRKDGQDNDNDDGDNDPTTSLADPPGPDLPSIDNETEQFIHGTINVNTAPLHILTLGSPLAESIDDTEKLMRTVVAYRDQPILAAANYPDDPTGTPFQDTTGTPNIRELTNRSSFAPNAAIDRRLLPGYKPGIASMGELMFLNPYGVGASTANNRYNMYRYGLDGGTSLPSKVDLYPDPGDLNSTVVPLGDDNEQKLARFQMLGQTFTVRSDRFVVYAVVRGYDWDPNKVSPNPMHGVPAETAQFIAVFDRGSMKDKNDTPRVIGYVRLQ